MPPAVRLIVHEPDQVTAEVEGRGQRNFYVDQSPRWGDQWFCTCTHDGRPRDGVGGCSHVRAVKAHIDRKATPP